MVISKEREGEVRIWLSGPILIRLNRETGEVNITPVKEVPKEVIKGEGKKDEKKNALQQAFSRAFATLINNKVASLTDAPEPVNATLEQLYGTTLELVKTHPTNEELRIFVERVEKQALSAAKAENVIQFYLPSALNILEEEMRRAVVASRPQKR